MSDRNHEHHAEAVGHEGSQGHEGDGERSRTPTPPDCAGGGGEERGTGLLGDSRHVRRDARLVARMMSLGVISEEQSAEILRQGFILAAKSAQKGDARGYAACMSIATAAARMEQEERKMGSARLVRHEHAHIHALRQDLIGHESEVPSQESSTHDE